MGPVDRGGHQTHWAGRFALQTQEVGKGLADRKGVVRPIKEMILICIADTGGRGLIILPRCPATEG